MLDVPRVRASFPILSRSVNGQPLVYLDSAASSLTPEEVLDAQARYYRSFRANVHRGRHALSEEATDAFEGARAAIARAVGARSSGAVVFTAGTTAAINLIADGLPISSDAEILTTAFEHHSAVLPWQRRWTVKRLDADPLQPIDPDSLRRHIGPRTRVVVLAHASNVTGIVQPVEAICRVAREHGVLSVVDAAQSAPHIPVDVEAIGCDFLAFSGHKSLGPTGIGVLAGRRDALESLAPRDIGGGAVDRVTAESFEWREVPERLEAGTPNVAGAIGLAAALAYLRGLGADDVRLHTRTLARALKDGLADIPGVRLFAAEADELPIASFAVDGLTSSVGDLSIALSDRYGVMSRAGFHCAHPLFEALGVEGGALRLSAHVYNTCDEIARACQGLRELLFVLRSP